jgi:UDP-4-amino-4,6-dideoxy-N-acetyl-beta-L-altrosamine transaminase
MIPYGHQSISQQDIQAVIEVLKSDWLTQGPTIERFEKAVADYCGTKYAIAVNSATSALHLACLAAGLEGGDSLWTSPNTFVASANCGLYCGARVNFVDIDPCTYNLSMNELARKLAKAKLKGTLPKVVVPVHFAGQSCEMAGIAELAGQYGFTVIEDASHAIGGSYQETMIGSCAFSDMTVFSFHPVKIITTGEGGMVLTNRDSLYQKLVLMRSHGITRDPELMQGGTDGPWHYQQIELGFNYRMTDIQAALGLSQIKRIDRFIERRRFLAKRYTEAFAGLPLTLPWQHPQTSSSFHLYVIRLKLDEISCTHREFIEELREAGIMVNLHYIPVHTQPYYRRFGFEPGDFPEAEKYYGEAVSLPIYYDLTEQEQDIVIELVRSLL